MVSSKLKSNFDLFWEKLEGEAMRECPVDPLGQQAYKVGVLKSLLEYHYLNNCKISTLIDFYLEDKF